MSIVAPPPVTPPRPDEREALIREARERQRKRWLGAAAVVALLAGAALGLDAIMAGESSNPSRPAGGPTPAAANGKGCGIRVADTRIVDAGGSTVYREPGNWTPGYPRSHVVRCSGSSIWVVWDNGAASSQEAYVGAHSIDRGSTWHLIFAENYFGVNAAHELDSYLGPWALLGPRAAYFTGWCPVCGGESAVSGTTSLWVTKDGGRTFREYRIPALIGYEPVALRVSGRDATISAKGFFRGVWRRKTVTVHVE